MSQPVSYLLSILTSEEDRAFAEKLALVMGYPFSHIVMGDGHEAARFLAQQQLEPKYILLMIGARKESVLEELNALALQCKPGTEVIVVGETNDIRFYRELADCGVLEYFAAPAEIGDVARRFGSKASSQLHKNNRSCVIAMCSAAPGDGASSVAVNLAYALSFEHRKRVVLIDMDYQYGMIAKNLDISSPYGIKELFDHPDRGIDTTLIDRMVSRYRDGFDLIAAPNMLRLYPEIRPELIRDLLDALRQQYDYVLLDLPHLWTLWIAASMNLSDNVVQVSQLWLKSIAHASRQFHVWRDSAIDLSKIHIVINRSGAKFKEGVTAKDFERVCQRPILCHLANDTRLMAEAETYGKTVLELGKSKLADDVRVLAQHILKAQNKNA